jgi:ABC-2 type transport system ATP-binding protein
MHTAELAQPPLHRATAGGAPPTVTVRGLTKRYGERVVVDDLSFSLHAGRITGFLGPNGAGKTTTIRMLLGLATPTSGTFTVLGHDAEARSHYLPLVGALIEGPAFVPSMSARECLRMFAAFGGHTGRIDAVLELVGLLDRAAEPVRGFSLGMRQRLGIAAALLPDPQLLILDEPTNGLDPAGIREIRVLLRRLAGEGRTILVSSHLLAEIQEIADDLIVIRQGRRLYAGPAAGLLADASPAVMLRPEHPHDLERLRNVLASLGLVGELGSAGLRVADLAGQTPAAINRAAAQHGITLAELHAEQPDLEATFLAMTDDRPQEGHR